MVLQQVSDGALRHHPAVRLPSRVHSEHVPPRRQRPASNRSHLRARPHSGTRGRSYHTHCPWHSLAGQPGFSIDRTVRRRHPPLRLIPTCRRTSSRCAVARWAHMALRAAYTGGSHVAFLWLCLLRRRVVRAAREDFSRFLHPAYRSLLGRGGTTAVRAACTGMASRAGGSVGL